jgi:hypothetical protein
MKKFALSLIVCAVASASSWEKIGKDYESKSAATKKAELWSEITANQETYGWYNALSLGGLFTESMDPSLQFVGDTFQDGLFGPRKKLIHSVGSVAQVKFVPTANQEGYTGLFKGADHGLIRLSLAK